MYKVFCDSYLLFDTTIENLKIINPKLDIELNKTGSFEFSIYPEHPYFDKLNKLKSIVKVYQDDYLLFKGRILNDDQGFHNEKQVSCEGELAFLLDSVQRPYEFSGTPAQLFTQYIENHNATVEADKQFTVGNITVTDPNDYINRSCKLYPTTWDEINDKLIDKLGGYLWVRHEDGVNYIDYLADFDVLSSQKIEFGKNLLDLKKVISGEDIATVIVPLGAKNEETEERLTIKSVNNDIDYVYDEDAVALYGWISKTVEWDDVTLASNLLRKANEYLANSINLAVSLELSAFDLRASDVSITSFRLGTYISVKTVPHGLDSSFLVKKLSLDLTSPGSNSLVLGVTYRSFTEQSAGTTKTQNQVITNVTSSVDSTKGVVSELETSVQNISEQTYSQIAQSSEEILSTVSEDYYLKTETDELISSVNTKITQNKDEVEIRFNQFSQDAAAVAANTNAQFQQISKYIRFVDGNILLGEDGNTLMLKIQNDRISFLESGAEVAYFSNRKLYVTDGEYLNSLTLGNFAFIPRANGNLSFKKMG